MTTDAINTPYSEARLRIQDADLLLWRPTSWMGWIIARGTGSPYSHASKAAWVTDDVLFTIGTEEGKGGTAELLSALVAAYPGMIDVYAANPDERWPEYDRAASIAWSWRYVLNRKYGWWATIRAGLSRVIVLRWFRFFNPSRDDEANGNHVPNCSAACSMADRIGGGVDPVPGMADICTEPDDLSHSPFYRYRFTLVPDEVPAVLQK